MHAGSGPILAEGLGDTALAVDGKVDRGKAGRPPPGMDIARSGDAWTAATPCGPPPVEGVPATCAARPMHEALGAASAKLGQRKKNAALRAQAEKVTGKVK